MEELKKMTKMRELKICSYYGFIGIVFLLASFSCLFVKDKSFMKDFENTLDEEKKTIYSKIIKERKKLYIQGYVIGLLFAFLFLYVTKYLNTFSKQRGSFWGAIAILFIIQYFYYIISPKSMFMIEILDKNSERKAWIRVYRHMTLLFHISFIFGIIGTVFLFKIVC